MSQQGNKFNTKNVKNMYIVKINSYLKNSFKSSGKLDFKIQIIKDTTEGCIKYVKLIVISAGHYWLEFLLKL